MHLAVGRGRFRGGGVALLEIAWDFSDKAILRISDS